MSTNSRNRLTVILLVGPTAAGKTDLIEEIFSSGYEIINADSEQVYRGLSIGTAKPSADTLARVPHHLVDFLDPGVEFTVGDFVRAADRLAAGIAERGRIPVVAGGAAYYIRHFVFGLPGSPPCDPAVRAAVKRELEARGSEALHGELAALDPPGAARIAPADAYRVSRALEVIRQTGRPLSSFAPPPEPRAGYRFLILGLDLPREELKARIARRVDRMFAAGLPEEVRRLTEAGYDASTPALRGIGYREFFASGATTASVRDAIVLHSIQYAKRQRTFFRSLPGVVWIHPSDREKIEAYVSAFLDSAEPPENGP